MKTFTVPVYFGVRAETKSEAIAIIASHLEETLYDMDSEVFPYCDVGLEREVIEQETQP